MSGAMNKPRFEGRRVKLEEVCEIRSGGTPKRSVLEYWQDGTIPWVKISDMKGKYVCSTEECITESGMSNSSAKLFEKGTILYSIFASIGEVGILKIPAATNQAIAGFRVKDEYKGSVDRDYLYHWLRSRKALSKHSGRGAAQNNINLSILKSMELELPAIGDQRCIAAQFERVARLEEGVCNQLAALDDLRKSRFIEMFGDPVGGNAWPMRQLNELYRVGSSKRIYAKDLVKGGVPFYRLADVGCLADGTNPSVDSYITEERYAGLKAAGYVPGADDILVTSRGTLGKCYIVSGEDKFYFQDGMITWLARTGMSPRSRYLVALFSNNSFAKNLSDSCSGTTVRYLSISDLAKMRIPVPPMDLQDKYLAFVRQVDKLESAARASIDRLQTLYDSLAQEYFG